MLEAYLDLSSDSDSDAELDTLVLLYENSKKAKRPRSEYLKKRNTHGQFTLTKEFSDEQFLNYCRLSHAEFEEVHSIIRSHIYSEGCNAQTPIDTEVKLTVFLRYLATGDSYKSIGYSYRMGDRTESKIVNEVSTAIWKTMQPMYLIQPTETMWVSIASDFETRWNFPHCVGAIDGKHVIIKKPKNSGSSYFNYKHDFSIVLLAVVDARYRFTFIDVGSMGRFSDGSIFASSQLAKKLDMGTLQLPPPANIVSNEQIIPYVFVGDEAFPLMQNLMRPYPRRSVMGNYENKVFNYRLSRARQTVECTFGILASRFRVFQKPFEIKVTSVIDVVKAACVLHNYLRRNAAITSGDIGEKGLDVTLPTEQLFPISASRHRSVQAAFSVREKLREYFNAIGSVPWQEECVFRGHY